MRADNSSHLIEAAQQRRLQCIARVRTALDDLERDGSPVTIAGVAARAKVSRTFLYDGAQAPLLERLRAVANAQPSSGRPALPENQRISTKSHETIVRTLRGANQKLRQDLDRHRPQGRTQSPSDHPQRSNRYKVQPGGAHLHRNGQWR